MLSHAYLGLSAKGIAVLDNKIRGAIGTLNAVRAGEVADYLRFDAGMIYAEVLARVQVVVPSVTAGEWESLMQESDAIASGDCGHATCEIGRCER